MVVEIQDVVVEIKNINFKQLKLQKKVLLGVIQDFETNKPESHVLDLKEMQGVLNLLDSIQDYAVDVLKMNELDVFDLEEEEIKTLEIMSKGKIVKSGQFFKLNKDYNDFKKDCIVLLGDLETKEFFDITTEMVKGHSFSLYDIPPEMLTGVNNKVQSELTELLSNFIESNYELNNTILKY
jgi:hypothetical protein